MFSAISLPQVRLLAGSSSFFESVPGKNTVANIKPFSLSEEQLLALTSSVDLARHLSSFLGKGAATKKQSVSRSLSFQDLPACETARLVPAFCQANMPVSSEVSASAVRCGASNPLMQKKNCSPQVYVCGVCSSTFDIAWQLVHENRFNTWDSIVCAEQTEGRGQLRRHWHSPAGNLYVTFRLPQTLRGPDASLIVSYLLLQGLFDILQASADLAGVQSLPPNWPQSLKIKWPNDILLNEKYKVGGILLEERGDVLLAGFGLNLREKPPVRPESRHSESNEEDIFLLPSTSLADYFSIFSTNYSKKFQISPLGLWLLLVGRLAFWYDTKVKLASKVEQLAMLTPCLAWLGRGIQVYAPCFKNEASSLQAEHNFALCTGVLNGLGPYGELCLAENGRHHLLISGSLRLL